MDDTNIEGSSYMLPRLAKKGVSTIRRARGETLDEVWGDIQHHQERNTNEKRARGQHLSLGQITLADFLVNASVSDGANKHSQGHDDGMHDSDSVRDLTHSHQERGHWLELQVPSSSVSQQVRPRDRNLIGSFVTKHPVNEELRIPNGSVVDVFTDNIRMSASSISEAFVEMEIPTRKRFVRDNCLDKTSDRKHKRMMKNRESAARSRARKQAYTSELENKISHLEEENERLRKQKVLQTILLGTPPHQEQKCRLRRVSSASF